MGNRPELTDAFSVEDYFSFDIRPYVTRRRYNVNSTILSEGRTNEQLYFIQKGRVKVCFTKENGDTALPNFLEAPVFIGEMEFLGARESTSRVIAIKPCLCCIIRCAECREQILNDAKFLRHLCLMLGQRFVATTANFSANQTLPLRVRLARYILQNSTDGMYHQKHTETAAYLGVTYRHLLYVIAGLVQEGLLEKGETGYRIVSERALRQEAHWMP